MKTYFIYGHEVDKKTYEKYENKKFNIDGVELSMSGLRVWATSKEIDEELPEKAAAAREIYNDILRDIGAVEKAPPPKVAHKSFVSYIDELNEVFKQYNNNRTTLVSKLNNAQKEFDETMRDTSLSDSGKLIARGELEKQKQDIEKQLKNLATSFEDKTKAMREEFEVLVEDVFRATPDKIDAPSMQLINSGVMNISDLEYMAQQFRHNPTMLKIIAQHIKKVSEDLENKGKRKESTKANTLAMTITECTDPKRVYEGFDLLVARGKRDLETRASSYREDYGRVWDVLYNEIRNNFTNYFIQPNGVVTE